MRLTFHIAVKTPPAELTYALQKGSGSNYEVMQVQKSNGNDLHFDVPVEIKGNKHTNDVPDFKGPYVQGPVGGRFIYLGIGAYAGKESLIGAGRLKIPLVEITWAMIEEALTHPQPALQTAIPGTGKNGGPTYATVKPFDGWKVKA